jgi:hypothetical protein
MNHDIRPLLDDSWQATTTERDSSWNCTSDSFSVLLSKVWQDIIQGLGPYNNILNIAARS